MNACIVVLLSLGAAAPLWGQVQRLASPTAPARTAQTGTVRNPAFLSAAELLGRATPGVAPRVRFEWERVPGSTGYVLTGQWTSAQSWAMRSLEYRVDARNASKWESDRVIFDVSLPEGSHSWKLVAVFGRDEVGDYESPARVSFDVR